MAMTKCKECKQPVSAKAKVCPHCGIKDPGVSTKDAILGFLIFGGIIWAGFTFFGGDSDEKTKPSAEQLAQEAAACKQDLQCWGDKNGVSASVYCKTPVEKLAKYSAKWTDGMLDSKFSHFRWLNKDKGHITYIGDKIQFQNGFGAMQNHVYECDYDPSTNTPLEVRARPGQL